MTPSAENNQSPRGPVAEQRAAEGSITLLIERLRRGDQSAAERLWAQYFPRLLGLARRTLAGWPQAVSDADDAAQSAFVAFWQRAEQGALPEDLHRDNLWNLLATITVRKAQKHVQRERAQKRGGGHVVGEAALLGGTNALSLDRIASAAPAAEFDLRCEELLLKLDDELRRLALLRLMGYTTAEIASQLACTQRKVQRKLHLIQLRWRCEFEASAQDVSR